VKFYGYQIHLLFFFIREDVKMRIGISSVWYMTELASTPSERMLMPKLMVLGQHWCPISYASDIADAM
jgi:hypothetical protein